MPAIRFFILFSIFLGINRASITNNISPKETDINTVLENLANVVIRDYFGNNRCTVVISEPNLLRNVQTSNTRVWFEYNSELDDCYIQLYQFFRTTFVDNCDSYIVQFKAPLCAMKAWEETNKRSFIPRHNPKFFFLPVFPETLTYADDLMSLRVTDISANILAAEIQQNHSDWKVLMYTNNFYQHPSDEKRIPKLYLDEWRNATGFKENVDLYPDKIKDLKGKKFRVWVAKYLPFASDDPFDGWEVRVSFAFCEKHNCTPTMVTDGHFWGTVYPNFTGNGALGSVYTDVSDIGAFAVYLWLAEHYYIDYSASYLRGEVTVMTPKPTRIGGWMVPFLPFKWDLWIALFMSLVLSSVSLYSITKGSIKYTRFRDELLTKSQFTTLGDSWMRAIGLVVLQQPSSRLIGNSPNRYLFTSFEFLYLVLSAMYSAELASFLTIPLYNPPVDKFHDFAESGITWYGTHEAWVYSLKGSPDKDAQIIVENFRVLPMDQLKKVSKLGKYGFTAERCPGGSITEQDHVTSDVIPLYHIMKDYLFGSPLVTSIKKGGPYNKYYNKMITRTVEHGFTLYWEAAVAREYLDATIQAEYQEAKSIHVDSEPSVIRVTNIQGVIYIYSIGIILSCITFIYEKTKKDD